MELVERWRPYLLQNATVFESPKQLSVQPPKQSKSCPRFVWLVNHDRERTDIFQGIPNLANGEFQPQQILKPEVVQMLQRLNQALQIPEALQISYIFGPFLAPETHEDLFTAPIHISELYATPKLRKPFFEQLERQFKPFKERYSHFSSSGV